MDRSHIVNSHHVDTSIYSPGTDSSRPPDPGFGPGLIKHSTNETLARRAQKQRDTVLLKIFKLLDQLKILLIGLGEAEPWVPDQLFPAQPRPDGAITAEPEFLQDLSLIHI